jgi:predicted flap endonuclease-1-like 5' DNA nuclease
MEILKKYLCDWGSADSNMLLFFMLISFLLGLLTGWLIWGRKIQAMATLMAEKEATITDINEKLTAKEADLNLATTEVESLKLKIRAHEEEKGQLRSDLISSQVENDQLKVKLSAGGIGASVIAAAAMPSAEITAPNIELETPSIAATTVDLDVPSEVSDVEIATDMVEEKIAVVDSPAIIENVATEEVTTDIASDDSTVSTEKTSENQEKTQSFAAASTKDDLKIVEGIGPKIEELCNNIGIFTWNQLSNTPVSRLQEMLNEAGKRYQIHNPGTWPEQAKMAAEGAWEQLKIYQDHLKGGKEPE